MDAAVHDQALHGDAGDLAPHRVKRADDDRLGGVVDDEVDAGSRLKGADVPALAADDAALHVVVGQVDDADGAFRHVVGGALLNGQRDNVPRLLFAFFPGPGLNVPNHGGGVVIRVLLHPLDQHLTGLVLRHARNALQLLQLLVLAFFQLIRFLLQIGGALGQRFLPLFQTVLFLVEGLLPLQDAALTALHLRPAVLALPIQLGLQAKHFFLGFQNGLFFLFIRLALRVFQQILGVLLRAADLLFAGLLAVQIAARRACGGRQQRNDDSQKYRHWLHSFLSVSFPFNVNFHPGMRPSAAAFLPCSAFLVRPFQGKQKSRGAKNAPSAFCCFVLQNIANNEPILRRIPVCFCKPGDPSAFQTQSIYSRNVPGRFRAPKPLHTNNRRPLPPLQKRTDAGKSQSPTYIRKQPGSCACTGSPIQPTLYYSPGRTYCQAPAKP